MEEKNKRTNTGLVQLRAQEGGSLCDTFVKLHLLAIAGMYTVRNFHKATRNASSSLTVFSHCLLLATAISNRLFSSAFLCQLALSVFSRTFLPSSTPGIRAKIDKEIVWLAPTQTEMNCYASCHTSQCQNSLWHDKRMKQTSTKGVQNLVKKVIPGKLCKKLTFEPPTKRSMHKLESVLENKA